MYKVDRQKSEPKRPVLPMHQTPGLWTVLSSSLTGLILALNAVIFVLTCIYSHSIFTPRNDVLELLGARDTVLVAKGQYWRLLTANFLHIGLIHFLFNNYALYIVGWNLEKMWGKLRFFLLYIVCGISGNVLSQLVSVNISAGASASIFGLFGSGLVVEWLIKKKLAKEGVNTQNLSSVFAGLVLLNIGIGFVIPQIDNAAHVGGLISGVIMTISYFLSMDNHVASYKRPLSVLIILILSAAIAVGAVVGARPEGVEHRLLARLVESNTPYEKYYIISRLVKLSPDNDQYQIDRLSLSLTYGDYSTASSDVSFCLDSQARKQQCSLLIKKFSNTGLIRQAVWLEQRLKN